jgi:hypothetical protein
MWYLNKEKKNVFVILLIWEDAKSYLFFECFWDFDWNGDFD